MRFWSSIIAFMLAAALVVPASVAENSRRILLVVSSHGADNGKTRPGFEMDELSQAYAIFKLNGFALDIASPKGGAVVADEYDAGKPYNAALLSDPDGKMKIADTRAIADIDPSKYAALFIIGGKGAMFDLPGDKKLQQLVASVYDRNGVIGAVCHGPAALVNVRLADGSTFVSGRKITGFSNEEEELFGKSWSAQFPFLLENALKENGGIFGETAIMLPHVERDGRLITGQNPYSVTSAAEAVVEALGQTPLKRDAWKDESSMHMLARLVRGQQAMPAEKFAVDKELYDVPLIAIWGFYRAQSAGTDAQALKDALAAMELAAPHFPEPQLEAAITETRSKLVMLTK